MFKTKKIAKKSLLSLRVLALALVAVAVAGSTAMVQADQYQTQINALNAQNNVVRGQISALQSEATSYQDAISRLQAQINAIQGTLSVNLAKQTQTQNEISAANAKIEQQKVYLGEAIKAMYIDGQLSSIEQLAASNNLSDYVDKEEYRTSVQNKVDSIIKEVAALKAKLQEEKQKLDVLVKEQQEQSRALATAQYEQSSMLAYNESQQAEFNSKVSSNNKKIAELRRQQIAANARFSGGSGGYGARCGGGYPASTSGPIGPWGCNHHHNTYSVVGVPLDDWRMYNRECVSYAAFKVSERTGGRYDDLIGYWGSSKDARAKNWDDLARQANIAVDGDPRPGDIAVSNGGNWGHVMYVEAVYGDTIRISQYNADLDGMYSEKTISKYGLSFIHF